MGRPLTDKWTGNRSDRTNPVLTPYCNINGTEGYCWILRQIGSNKFLVQNKSDASLIGPITLTNGDSSEHGMGYLEWSNDDSDGYVERISDNTLRPFGGGNAQWSIYGDDGAIVYVSSNSDD